MTRYVPPGSKKTPGPVIKVKINVGGQIKINVHCQINIYVGGHINPHPVVKKLPLNPICEVCTGPGTGLPYT